MPAHTRTRPAAPERTGACLVGWRLFNPQNPLSALPPLSPSKGHQSVRDQRHSGTPGVRGTRREIPAARVASRSTLHVRSAAPRGEWAPPVHLGLGHPKRLSKPSCPAFSSAPLFRASPAPVGVRFPALHGPEALLCNHFISRLGAQLAAGSIMTHALSTTKWC